MKKGFIVFIIVLIGIGYVVLHTKSSSPTPITNKTPTGDPSFTWEYDPFIEQEFPKTHITLTATYPDGHTIRKEIDSVDGSCNDYSTPDKDVYGGSTMIICYAAGLGHYFKVVHNGTAYEVMRKIFEEGSPEYNPPERSFETIAQF